MNWYELLRYPTKSVSFPFPHLRTETDPVSDTLFFLHSRIPEMDKVQKPFRIHFVRACDELYNP
jgi:hypothetical protein